MSDVQPIEGFSPLDPGVLVDVGIPAWGHSRYLEEAIASVRRQTLSAWTLRVLQDGPPEPSVERLVHEAADSRITYDATVTPIGAPANKTALIRNGNARYVALLDHDDVWQPEFLARRVEFLEAESRCGFVFSPCTIIDGQGSTVARSPRLLPDGVYPSETIVPLLLEWDGIPGGSVVARRSAYDELDASFSDRLPHTYDYEMWVRLALRFPVGYLGVRDVCWRRHTSNASAPGPGAEAEFASLASSLSSLVARERPGLVLDSALWRRKVSALLFMTCRDALERGDRASARHYLTRAIRRDPTCVIHRRRLMLAAQVLRERRRAQFG
jgi:hypothetical protein